MIFYMSQTFVKTDIIVEIISGREDGFIVDQLFHTIQCQIVILKFKFVYEEMFLCDHVWKISDAEDADLSLPVSLTLVGRLPEFVAEKEWLE
jgi:hypothetical protein